MDGLTMVEKIRGELRNASLPVVMLTTENNPQMKERGGANSSNCTRRTSARMTRLWPLLRASR
jgi:CheY-like chemotaxis protein